MIFVAVDGDSIGAQVGQAVLKDDVAALKDISDRINAGQDEVESFIQRFHGQKISGGGDEFVFAIPEEAEAKLEELRQHYHSIVGATLSIGTGASLSEAGKALAYSKITGKDRITEYSDEIDKHLMEVHNNPQSEEEQKEDKAYLGALDNQDDSQELEDGDVESPEKAGIPQGEEEVKDSGDEDSEKSPNVDLKSMLLDQLNNDEDGGDYQEKEGSSTEEDSPQKDSGHVDAEQPVPFADGQEGQEGQGEAPPSQEDHEFDAEMEALQQNIGHSLEGIKQNKQFLDSLEQSNPAVYYSILLMMRNQIKMATLLGLKDDSQPQQDAQPQAVQQAPQAQQQPTNPDGSPMVVNDMGKQ